MATTPLEGGSGAETLDRGGTDAATYQRATAAVTVNLQTGQHMGVAAGDVFIRIEKIIGTNFDDISRSSARAASGTAGQLRYASDGTDTWLQADTNGDGIADIGIVLTGQVTPLVSDFML